MMRDLIVEFVLIICVSSRTLDNSPLRRLMEYEMLFIELKREEKLRKKWEDEDFEIWLKKVGIKREDF